MTTEYVVLEVANFLSPVGTRHLLAGLMRALHDDPRVTLVPATSQLMGRGCELYLARPDKSWSLTDCISFVIMQESQITDALSVDHHFEQAGFNLLLKAVS